MDEVNQKNEETQDQASKHRPRQDTLQQSSSGTVKNDLSQVWARLSDRNKAPGRWWFPPKVKVELSAEALQRQHDEISKTVSRLLLTIIAFSFFCLLTLGVSDVSLLGTGAQVQVPFANTKISFFAFLTIGPAVLIGLTVYLHIFVDRLLHYDVLPAQQRLPTIFNMDGPVPRMLSGFLFYGLVPLILLIFSRKAATTPIAGLLLFLLTLLVTGGLIWLMIRRFPEDRRREASALGVVLFGVAGFFMFCVALLFLARDPLSEYSALVDSLFGRRMHLFKANLKERDLRSASLNNAYMRKADLRGANLEDAFLRGADLSESELQQAILRDASMSDAIMREANLEGADLRRAWLSEADIRGANLTDANLLLANLRTAEGLTAPQIKAAKNWKLAYYPDSLLEKFGLAPNHNCYIFSVEETVFGSTITPRPPVGVVNIDALVKKALGVIERSTSIYCGKIESVASSADVKSLMIDVVNAEGFPREK